HGSHVGGFRTHTHRPNGNLQSDFQLRHERRMALYTFLEWAIWPRPHHLQQRREVGIMKRVLCKYRLWLLMTAALAGSLSLSAQEAHPRPASDFLDPRGGVTEEELVTRALASNPTLLAERQQIAMAKGDLTQARLR